MSLHILPNPLTATQITVMFVFLATYSGLAAGRWIFVKLDRVGIALLGGIAMLALGCIKLPQAVAAVNVESILLLFALMVIASQLHYAGFYGWLAEHVLESLTDKPAKFLAVLIALSGILSAFLNNDVVVLAIAPIVVSSLLKKKRNPIPFLIALALSSNIGCALTTIGNAQNVLIGEMGDISFFRYMMFAAVPVLLSLAVCYAIVYFLGRKTFDREIKTAAMTDEAYTDLPFNRWRSIKGTGVLLIIVILFTATTLPRYLVAMTGAGLLLCSHMLPSRDVLKGINWQLLLLFISLFVVVGAFSESKLADRMLEFLTGHGIDVNDPLQLAVIAGILSNCINNSATVMLLIHTVDLSDPMNCYALAMSNAFAGNFMVIGSLANIIAAQCAESFQLQISFREFFRYGAPTAIISMLILLGWLCLF